MWCHNSKKEVGNHYVVLHTQYVQVIHANSTSVHLYAISHSIVFFSCPEHSTWQTFWMMRKVLIHWPTLSYMHQVITLNLYIIRYTNSKVVLITNLKNQTNCIPLRKKVLPLSTLFVSRIIWQDLKFFRNVGRLFCFLLTIMVIILGS